MKRIFICFCVIVILLSTTGICNAQLIKTVVGSGNFGYNGNGLSVSFTNLENPVDVAFDTSGNMYIADFYAACIRKVSAATQLVSTVAGVPTTTSTSGLGNNGGAATAATLWAPASVVVDNAGNVYFGDWWQNVVYKVTAATGIINIVAGTGSVSYNGDGIAATAANLSPWGITLDAAGNLYICDGTGFRIRKVSAATGLISTIAGTGVDGYNGDGISATTAQINDPAYVCLDDTGNIYFSDQDNNRIRKISAATGLISTIAGTGFANYNGDGIPATTAQLYEPQGIKIDHAGNLYITDLDQNNGAGRIRRVDAITGLISTVAGTGNYGYNGDWIPATTANLSAPYGIALDNADNIYLAEVGLFRIRKINSPCGDVIPGTLTITGEKVACDSTADTINALGAGNNLAYQWQASTNGVSWTNVGSNATTYSTGTITTTTYYRMIVSCIYSGLSDTSVSDTITINHKGVPSVAVAASPGDTVCQGASIAFTATPTNGGANPSYQWTKNGIVVSSDTSYTDSNIINNDVIVCTMTSSSKCVSPNTATKTSAVYAAPVPVMSINAAPDACANKSLTISGVANDADVANYEWDFGGGQVLSGSGAGPYDIVWSSAGIYTVSLTGVSNYNCPSNEIDTTINVHDGPQVSISTKFPTNFCIGDTIFLSAGDSSDQYAYLWGPAEFFRNNTGMVVTADVLYPTNISVTVTDKYGCQASDSVYANAQQCCIVSFPTAFSPNGDGRNDLFRPLTVGSQNIGNFIVENRWGQIVFSSANLTNGWDGMFNGVPQEIGVYSWYIQYDCNGKIIQEKGDVTLVR